MTEHDRTKEGFIACRVITPKAHEANYRTRRTGRKGERETETDRQTEILAPAERERERPGTH